MERIAKQIQNQHKSGNTDSLIRHHTPKKLGAKCLAVCLRERRGFAGPGKLQLPETNSCLKTVSKSDRKSSTSRHSNSSGAALQASSPAGALVPFFALSKIVLLLYTGV